jgi:8-oxo-dGTP pyrophosphatase MutT (NUDIX family)
VSVPVSVALPGSAGSGSATFDDYDQVVERDFPVGGLAGAAERARAWLAADAIERERVALVPRLAATVMLLRQTSGGPEVFMMRRAASMAFAARMMVFPGGAVESSDGDPAVPWSGMTAASWGAAAGLDAATARSVVVAAVREVFEECGVLLASPAPRQDGDAGLREAVAAGQVSFAAALAQRGARIDAGALVARAHWITPPFESRRFDTWILAAAMPPGQRIEQVSGEADRWAWTRPADVLADAAAGRAFLLPPTLVVLEELADVGSVTAYLTAAAGLDPVLPELIRGPDGEPLLRAQVPRP